MNAFSSWLAKNKWFAPVFVSVILVSALIYWLVNRNKEISPVDPEYSKYVDAYTSGVVSKKSSIRIQLASDIGTSHTQNELVEEALFNFSPSISGKAYWVDAQTIEFRPDEDLQPSKTYDATFKLGKVIKVDDKFQDFDFQFSVIKPSFEIENYGLSSEGNSLELMKFNGLLRTADAESPEKVEQIVSAHCDGKGMNLSWQHSENLIEHRFTIDSIKRGNSEQTIVIRSNGNSLSIDQNNDESFAVPAIGDFKVIGIRAVNDPEQYVRVQFSDPLAVAQDLQGLITVGSVSDLRYTINGSEVKVYAPDRLDANYSVMVNTGIQNVIDKKLEKLFSANVFFENRLPSVSIPGKGVILPSTGKLVMPFDAANLKAVDVSIIKIYENNIPQYLQTNNLNGEFELRRVGKPIVQKVIRLDTDPGVRLNRKNRFALDIDKLIRTEPGAIYRVTIGFRKSYSLFTCDGKEKTDDSKVSDGEDEESEEYSNDNVDEDDEFWSRYDSYYPYGYNWNEREDPCSNSFYNKQKWAVRNVLASNIGLIAKRGNDNRMVVVATDILTTKPLVGVELQFLDFQQQFLFKTVTDAEGIVHFDLKKKPYLLLAKKGAERGYLRLDDGGSLPLGRFNVGGDKVQSGLKGFIYGERGVWRPGDSLFVTFILEDKANKLPKGHPVTFELYTPHGQLSKRLVQTKSLNGFYSFHTLTDAGAPTGNWLAKVKVGGAIFEKTLKIETIMPNRLKINLDFGGQAELYRGSDPEGKLNARWLFGGVAKNLKAKVDVSLTAQKTTFPKFKGYSFDDPTAKFSTENKTIFDGNLDENGNALVKANMKVDKLAPGILKANFLIKVFEPGGNFSIDQFSLPYHVFNSYVGIRTPVGDELTGMLPTSTYNAIEIASVTPKGLLITGSRSVEVELYKVQWKWWWDESDDDFSNFTQDDYNKFIKKETVQLQNGEGRWNLHVTDEEWGRYLIRIKDLASGHVTGKLVYVDNPYWNQRLTNENPTEASMLSFTSDKEKYNVGENIALTIPSSEGGRALVSIESGSRVLKTFWTETTAGQTHFKFKAESNMAPNVFVNVTLLQPHSQTKNDLPIRMYGTIPVLIEDKNTILKPVISMPETIRPESASSITVSESSGKAMTYTIALVDEGLLDITRFKTPDPHSVFYAREAIGVKTWDLFDYVIGAWGGDLERILSIGGDQGINKNAGAAKANRFKPVVKYLGPFSLKAGQKQTHNFKLPQYVGSIRAMVIAGENGAYGYAEKAVAVKKPLMLLATMPRTLSPGEVIKLPVTVFAMEKNIHNVNVSVQSNLYLEVVGEKTKAINFSQPGEQLVYFDVKVKQAVGIAKVKIIAQSGAEKADDDVELDVRNPNPVITRVYETTLQPGKTWNQAYQMIGMAGSSKCVLEVSSIPAINLSKRLNYLIQYPHGCVEQITSSVFPQLYLNQLTDLGEQQKAEIDRNIKAGINRLNGFQTSDGGLSYWPGSSQADEWGTNYAGHFMIEAQDRGYNLPPAFLQQWKKFQKGKAVGWTPSSTNFYGGDLVQSYRLYLLALTKSPEMGAMNRLKEFKYISMEAKWRLAAAYQLAGQPEVAASLVKGLSDNVKPYKALGGTFGSDLRDEAMILETLTLMGRKAQGAELVKKVAARLSQDEWYSTQTTAYSLIAIAKYCGTNTGAKVNYTYQLGGNKGTINANSVLSQISTTKGGNAIVQNTGKNILYARIILSGQPAVGDDISPTNNEDILQMQVVYKTMKGEVINPDKLVQGTDFVAEVKITNPGKRGTYEQMALSQVFPAGWEILNTRLLDNESMFNSSASTYKDIRDDRVYTYFDLRVRQTVTYHVLLNAAYLGHYYMPGTYCEAMYDATINASTQGKWVDIALQ